MSDEYRLIYDVSKNRKRPEHGEGLPPGTETCKFSGTEKQRHLVQISMGQLAPGPSRSDVAWSLELANMTCTHEINMRIEDIRRD